MYWWSVILTSMCFEMGEVDRVTILGGGGGGGIGAEEETKVLELVEDDEDVEGIDGLAAAAFWNKFYDLFIEKCMN